jgi:hypothetical protein
MNVGDKQEKGGMMFDKNKFKEVVDRSGYKGTFIAKELGMSYALYLQKSNGYSQWKADEIMSISETLRLRKQERDAIFFCKRSPRNGD